MRNAEAEHENSPLSWAHVWQVLQEEELVCVLWVHGQRLALLETATVHVYGRAWTCCSLSYLSRVRVTLPWLLQLTVQRSFGCVPQAGPPFP